MSPKRYTPPPIGEVGFIGRAGLVVEVAPNQFYEFILEIRHGDPGSTCEITLESTLGDPVCVGEYLEPIRYIGPRTTYADIHLRGRVISKEEAAQRPSWATGPQSEIEARREIGQ